MTNLEQRLRHLDLRFEPVGDHLDEERLAGIATGADPDETEAAHLAACDECIDLLTALGVGLEQLEADPILAAPAPGASARPAAARRRPRLGLILGSLGFAFAAAAAVGVSRHWSENPPAVEPPPAVQARPVVEPSVVAPPAVPATETPASAAVTSEPARPAPPDPPETPSAAATSRQPAPRPAPANPRALPSVVGEVEPRAERSFEGAPVHAEGRGFGFLRLSATPQARVFIDDRPYGWTPIFDLRLAEGPHDVRLVYEHPDAGTPEERFRVVIPAEEHWVVKRRNLRAAPP